MAQISANTLTYDQIYLKIRDFYIKENSNQFGSNQERLTEYKKLISDIYQSVGGPTTKINLFIKGEPPVSEKFNNFASSVADDFTLVSKQLDYLNAKTVNAYNLFAQEIDSEKKYLDRIFSKAKILQMYSNAPAEDIVYIGDSFDNQDQIDITQVAIGLNPHIENGAFSLPVFRSRPWYPRSVTIKTSDSNGFLGNYHEVKKTVNADNSEVYEYIYKNNRTLPALSAISDENPLTYFEYEGVNVDKNSNLNVDKNLVSSNEFSYIANKKVSSGKTDGQLIDWSNFDMSNNLKLTLLFEAGSPTLANCFTISPYFGSCDLIKVSSVKATLQDGTVIDILSTPIYIGSSFAPMSLQIANSYFYNKATVRFSEARILKFEVVLEQENYKDIDIHHVYWKPNYQSDRINESPFASLSRFNPDALSRDVYEIVEYDKYGLLPEITLPSIFKDKDQISKVARVRLKKRPESFSGYVIVLEAKVNNSNRTSKFYFYNFDSTTSEADDFGWVENVSDLFQPSRDMLETYGVAKYSKTIDELIPDLSRARQYLGYEANTNLVRIDGSKYLALSGIAGNYASTADVSSLRITGSIEIVMRLAALDWTPTNQMKIISKAGNLNQRAYALTILTGGHLCWSLYPDGDNGATPYIIYPQSSIPIQTAASLSDGQSVWIKATWNNATDVANFYWAADQVSEPTSWNLIGAADVPAVATGIFPGTSPLVIGTIGSTTEMYQGKIYRAIVRDGIGGSTVYDADFSIQSVGATSFTETTGKTVTINGSSAKISEGITYYDNGKNTIISQNPYTKYEFLNPYIDYVEYTTVTQASSIQVPVTMSKELYRAKRKSIGLRDISFSHETYADRAEIVSTPYRFDYPIESIMISSDSTIDNKFDDKLLLNYYISVNNSSWIQISPVQLSSSGIAEVLVFNQNIPTAYQIPGVSYFNYPTIPSEINSVRVKIEMFRDRLNNVTPIVYSYKLIAKVKK